MKPIPLVDIKAQYREIKEELFQSWEEVFASMHLMMGPNMKSFEKEFAAYSGARYGIGVGSGTGALFLALKALGVKPGDEVITVSYTFFATIEAIRQNLASPVLLDIDEKTQTMSVEKLNEFVNKSCRFDGETLFNKTTNKPVRAIVPVHIYGQPADMREICEIAGRFNLKVLEDCAQAHGATYQNQRVGSMGDAAAYSFYFSKNLSALGEGGLILTKHLDQKETLEKLRVHGQSDKYTHEMIGYNSRLDELQAVVLRLKLKHLDSWNQARINHAARYSEQLKDTPLILPAQLSDRQHVYHLYVVRSGERDELFKHLQQAEIGCGIHYPIPSHLQPALSDLGYKRGDFPVTERVSDEVLSLPMYPHLTSEAIDRVVYEIKQFFN